MGELINASWRSEWLEAVIEPIAARLEPLGYRLGETYDSPPGVVDAIWETDVLFVQAGYEGREGIFDVMVARPLPHFSPFMQPYWSKVYLSEVLRERGIAEARVELDPGSSPEGVRRFAEGAALDLAQIVDILRGENLEILDRIIASRPRMGVRGIDYPT